MRAWWILWVAGMLLGCAHKPLSPSALDETRRVAFLSRIDENAGPLSTVFRDDDSYRERLKRLDSKEGDRRLSLALAKGSMEKNEVVHRSISRFEVADSLRSQTLALLPRQAPWDDVVHPAEVARVLESFLVQEVPANAPDYNRVAALGADTVVEIVVEEYGMRSERGRAGVFMRGLARMFRIGGAELYHRSFDYDDVTLGLPALDPFAVRKNTELYAERMRQAVMSVSTQVAADLTPAERREVSPRPQPIKRSPSPAEAAPAADDPL